ncbi:hypothetical protein PENNAL_c0643G07436, partial [Penicillium nalgiovense]
MPRGPPPTLFSKVMPLVMRTSESFGKPREIGTRSTSLSLKNALRNPRQPDQRQLYSAGKGTLLRRYYEKVFQNLQQTNCRVIAKAYVKVVEPRKQLQYPYNGRKTVAGITRQMSPEDTKPPWWPPGVSHREPDHLLKAERIALLVHILCELRVSHGITAQKLKIAEQPSRRLISPMGRSRLLDELYTVRAAEEKFVEGLI